MKYEEVKGSEVEVSLPEAGMYWVVVEWNGKRWSKGIMRE